VRKKEIKRYNIRLFMVAFGRGDQTISINKSNQRFGFFGFDKSIHIKVMKGTRNRNTYNISLLMTFCNLV